jgi:hypothetical protein
MEKPGGGVAMQARLSGLIPSFLGNGVPEYPAMAFSVPWHKMRDCSGEQGADDAHVTLLLAAAAAVAGALGPFDAAGTADTGIEAVPACADMYPFDLVTLQGRPTLFRVYDPSRTYGTQALMDVLVEATARVAAAWPEADPVLVGDLSLPRGGPFPPHKSHDTGRSADLGVFVGEGRQPVQGFLPIPPDTLDLPRTWSLLEALLDTGRVRFLLLDQRLIDRLVTWLRAEQLLDEGRLAQIFPPASTPGLWSWEGIVRHAADHRDHVHVELRCD